MTVRHEYGNAVGIPLADKRVFVGSRAWSAIVFWGDQAQPTGEVASDELWAAYVQHCLTEGEPR